MTNPMYLGEIDDAPAFIHDDESKVIQRFQLFPAAQSFSSHMFVKQFYLYSFPGQQTRFANPVYESMYADTMEPTLLNTNNCNGISSISGSNNISPATNSVLEEKTGLLQQDEPNIQDLL